MMKTSRLAQSAMIAAIYAVLTLALPAIGFGIVQFRLGEAMCVLPFFLPSAAFGLTLGCLISNAIGVAMGATTVWDILFGTLAAIALMMALPILTDSYHAEPAVWKTVCFIIGLVPLPAVMANALIIGAMLTWVMTGDIFGRALLLNIASIGVSQTLSCYGLGIPLLKLLKRIKIEDILSQTNKK